MIDNPVTPPRQSLVHEQWRDTMKALYQRNDTTSAVGELAYFCWQVLDKCGDSDELADFLDKRALVAFESVEGS